jgi:hypothetical protein
MTSKSIHPLVGRIRDLRESLLLLLSDEAWHDVIHEIEETVRLLQKLRAALDSGALQDGSTLSAIDHLLSFLARASEDERLRVLLRGTKTRKRVRPSKPKRQPIKIEETLTNDQIRELLKGNLSRDELRAIAKQRGISGQKRNTAQLRDAIISFLDKQDSYAKLGS